MSRTDLTRVVEYMYSLLADNVNEIDARNSAIAIFPGLTLNEADWCVEQALSAFEVLE